MGVMRILMVLVILVLPGGIALAAIGLLVSRMLKGKRKTCLWCGKQTEKRGCGVRDVCPQCGK